MTRDGSQVEPGIYFNDYNIGKALANPEQVRHLSATTCNTALRC